MDPHVFMTDEQCAAIQSTNQAFADQLVACLGECARGRTGLFGEAVHSEDGEPAWPEAAQLRVLAVALQSIMNEAGERSALCDEFLDLCGWQGEANPGEPRVARSFLTRIEHGEVGSPTQVPPAF